jgi:hypothetical protein
MCQNGSKSAHRWTQAEEAKEAVADWLNGLATDVHDKGSVKLVQRLDKCLDCNGDYSENKH